MDWVKDKMGLRFGCDTILLFLHKTPNSPLPLPTCTIHLHHREKEASALLSFRQTVLLMEKVEDLEEELVVEGEKGLSECSSECQSGWTLYLCQSQDDSLTTSSPPTRGEVSVHEDEEDDLSMLSDASSGPPHVTEEDCINFCYCSNDGDGCLTTFARNEIRKRRKAEEENQKKQRRQKENSSFLDDTASSPLLCFSKATSSISSSCSSKRLLVEDVLELSCGFSANHFKRKAAFRKASLKKDMGLQARRREQSDLKKEQSATKISVYRSPGSIRGFIFNTFFCLFYYLVLLCLATFFPFLPVNAVGNILNKKR